MTFQKTTHPWLPDGEFRVARAVGSNAGEDADALRGALKRGFVATENTTDFPRKVALLEGKWGPRLYQGHLGS